MFKLVLIIDKTVTGGLTDDSCLQYSMLCKMIQSIMEWLISFLNIYCFPFLLISIYEECNIIIRHVFVLDIRCEDKEENVYRWERKSGRSVGAGAEAGKLMSLQ